MVFQENFLQLVWKYQYFDKNDLKSTLGIPLSIKKIGFHNFHEGPDFLEAQVDIGKLTYYGNVEIHLKSSDWHAHEHQSDERYESVILHVVYEHDREIKHPDGTPIPTLELKGKIFLDVLRNYERLISGHQNILCSETLGEVSDILKFSMLEKALVERFIEKSQSVRKLLADNMGDWEETTYQWLFQCFGFKTNSKAMLLLAKSIPYKLIKKHANHPGIVEALLLGQAGLLENNNPDEYTLFLRREFNFYKTKYQLPQTLFHTDWKFMGVRPGNFPSVRIVQLSHILCKSPNLLSTILSASNTMESMKGIFLKEVPPYWTHHYAPAKTSQRKLSKHLSPQTLHLLAINFVVPLWFAYGKYIDEQEWQDKCFDFLQALPGEENFIIKRFKDINWPASTAFDTQGMIGLHNNYCIQKKCLECKIGQNLLRPSAKQVT
ncbi:DUF2851 family protein [Litoribacter populi]|uniref:DUF2851 family protein n=1 Tax=Litoribacter populi TaxID=2598460 RepID=UPI00118056BA|nr:DUF2851 family protein [Litoribacter populi]